jgi:hypothetical protein
MKYSYHNEGLHKRSALPEINPRWKHSLVCNEITAENHCMAEVHLWSRPIHFCRPPMLVMMPSQRSIVMDNRSPPTVSHTFHELYCRDVHGESQFIRAPVNCGATVMVVFRSQ